jgi:hypothetical protein
MTGGSRADGVQLLGRRRAVKLSDLVGFGLSDTYHTCDPSVS